MVVGEAAAGGMVAAAITREVVTARDKTVACGGGDIITTGRIARPLAVRRRLTLSQCSPLGDRTAYACPCPKVAIPWRRHPLKFHSSRAMACWKCTPMATGSSAALTI